MITAALGHPQYQKRHKCVAELLRRITFFSWRLNLTFPLTFNNKKKLFKSFSILNHPTDLQTFVKKFTWSPNNYLHQCIHSVFQESCVTIFPAISLRREFCWSFLFQFQTVSSLRATRNKCGSRGCDDFNEDKIGIFSIYIMQTECPKNNLSIKNNWLGMLIIYRTD